MLNVLCCVPISTISGTHTSVGTCFAGAGCPTAYEGGIDETVVKREMVDVCLWLHYQLIYQSGKGKAKLEGNESTTWIHYFNSSLQFSTEIVVFSDLETAVSKTWKYLANIYFQCFNVIGAITMKYLNSQ